MVRIIRCIPHARPRAGLYPDKYYSISKTTTGWLPRLQQRTCRRQSIVEHLVLVRFAADPLCSHVSCLVECDLLADSNLRGRAREQEHLPIVIRVLVGLCTGQPREARLEG